MKIIIVGAGITGLSTYLHLRKHLPAPSNAPAHSIIIYESHKPRLATSPQTASTVAAEAVENVQSVLTEPEPTTLESLSSSTAIVGGGLGISPNGMRVLKNLSSDIHDAVSAQGFPVHNFVFKGANGWTLGVQPTGDGKARKELQKEKGDDSIDTEEELCVSSSRHGLWRCLMEAVTKEDGNVVKFRKVVSVERRGGKPFVKSVDITSGEEVEEDADLLIGADGVKSIVRKAAVGDAEQYNPVYTGLAGVGGFLKQPIPAFIREKKAMVFTFGNNGFFGYASGGPVEEKSIMWWSTFETSNLPDTKRIDPVEVREAVIKRHKNWKDPILQDIINGISTVESIYPTWVVPDLPTWGEKGIVLIGDAAHALSPTTGQGASQGLEDSQTLALLLSRSLERSNVYSTDYDVQKEQDAIDLASKLFYDIRFPRIKAIADRGRKLDGNKADVGIVLEYFMYFFFYVLIRYPAIGKYSTVFDNSMIMWTNLLNLQEN
jgi:2-polyprenyl-6-methoxyphenol hydroxylase-like FAD-dependent oxidoreductase